MNRRTFLTSMAAASLASSEQPRPNILLMLADDLGIGDLSCYGGTEVETPHLDALAKQSVRFLRSYAASAVCSPTRAACLTGRYPLRFNIRAHFPDKEEHLPPGVATLPALLGKAGYGTVHIGKWHLGGLNRKHLANRSASIPGPLQHGFDHYCAMAEDPAERAALVKERRLFRFGVEHFVRDEKPVEDRGIHLTDFAAEEAMRWMTHYRQRNQPFFINLWFDAPHFPFEPTPGPHLQKYKDKAQADDLLYRATVSHLDAAIGRLMAKLAELGIERDTVVLFSSDNGPAMQGSPSIYKGKKADLHEGGIRVPLLIRFPGRFPPRESKQLAHTADYLPTLCAAAGVKAPADVDGVNLLPHLLSGVAVQRGMLFWQMNVYATHWQTGDRPRPYKKPEPYATEVVRDGDWKLLAKEGEPLELFHLAEDPREERNLIGEHNVRAQRMVKALRAYLKQPRLDCCGLR
ncbi:MAG: sulfatase-like hydrolase/transferase [Bryobacterales bacterium]|nr:sulfatase-like hydrolase/transferase [Bryobacterales bacterium]